MKPTVIRAPTLAEANSRLHEAVDRALLLGIDFHRVTTRREGGDRVVTIYWQEAKE